MAAQQFQVLGYEICWMCRSGKIDCIPHTNYSLMVALIDLSASWSLPMTLAFYLHLHSYQSLCDRLFHFT